MVFFSVAMHKKLKNNFASTSDMMRETEIQLSDEKSVLRAIICQALALFVCNSLIAAAVIHRTFSTNWLDFAIIDTKFICVTFMDVAFWLPHINPFMDAIITLYCIKQNRQSFTWLANQYRANVATCNKAVNEVIPVTTGTGASPTKLS